MDLDDTIVAIATPLGRGGIGVVRLAGLRAVDIASPMLRLRHPLEPARAIFGELIEPSCSDPRAATTPDESAQRIDEVVVTFFAKPHSYTTDDIIEISAHGSPIVLRHIVELCIASGARLAEPGEFTMRAFLNGRIDLTQAEAVRDLIDSQTLFQAKVAAQQLGGALSKRLQPVKQKLVKLIAALEAGIDFAEDDISILPDAIILEQIEDVRLPLQQLAASFAYGKIVHEGLTLAIVGRPNVGKSSLFNRLLEQERAIVTAAPGTTRDLVTETVSIGGIPLRLVDTAGIGHALDEAEAIGIQKSMEALADADMVLVVIDASRPTSGEDDELIVQVTPRSAILIENKIDLPSRENSGTDKPEQEKSSEETINLNSRKQSGFGMPRVATSALTGKGIAELRAEILRKIGCDGGASNGYGDGLQNESGLLTSARHEGLVRAVLTALEAATNAVTQKIPHEMLLLDLYTALSSLDAITGATTKEDILNLIFSTFCIGK